MGWYYYKSLFIEINNNVMIISIGGLKGLSGV